jgi:nucleoid-associated protein YgaU
MSEFLRHTTGPRDRWDLLADRYYGDPLRYGPILQANQVLGTPTVLPEGVDVLIPILDEAEPDSSSLPPWRA